MINLKLTTLAINWNTRKLSTFFLLNTRTYIQRVKCFMIKWVWCGLHSRIKAEYCLSVVRSQWPNVHFRTSKTHKTKHLFNYKIFCHAPTNTQHQKTLEALLIIIKQSLIEETNFGRLVLFRNGMTWCVVNLIENVPIQ